MGVGATSQNLTTYTITIWTYSEAKLADDAFFLLKHNADKC
jgi:hypothetical protein